MAEEKAKKDENVKVTHLVGSEGAKDYIVIGRHEDLHVGLKVFCSPNPVTNKMLVLFRVRVAEAPKGKVAVSEYLQSHPCLFAFTRVNKVRVSKVLMFAFPTPWNKGVAEVCAEIDSINFTQGIVDFLSGYFKVTTELSVILEFLGRSLEASIKTIKDTLAIVQENVPAPIKDIKLEDFTQFEKLDDSGNE